MPCYGCKRTVVCIAVIDLVLFLSVASQSLPKLPTVDDRPQKSQYWSPDQKNSGDIKIPDAKPGPNTSFSLNNLGVSLANAGQYDQAAKILIQATELTPGLYQAHRNLSIVYDALKRPMEALIAARRAVEVAPNEPNALIQWCEVSLAFSTTANEAASCYKRLESISPLDTESTGLYGLALYKAGKFDDAILLLEKACVGPNENPNFLNALGLAHFAKKRYQKAAGYFKQSVEIDPDRGAFRFNLGIAQIANRNRAGALSQYRLLKDGNPKLAERLYRLLYRNMLVSVDELRANR